MRRMERKKMCIVKNCNGWKFSVSDYLCAFHQKEEEKAC